MDEAAINSSEFSLKKKISFFLVGALFSIVIAATVGEIGVRIISESDANGNFLVQGRRIKPYRLPTGGLQEKVNSYLLNGPSSGIGYDPVLGWSSFPNTETADGMAHHGTAGIRSASTSTDYAPNPRQGTLRIALFGDSFTWGAEVPDDGTWAYFLESSLNKAGMDAEVLNFGVPGYGMDQAFLRWKLQGAEFSPDVVIFGFQAENGKRNLNLYRPFYAPTTDGIFSKPRFVIEADQLKLVNSPTVPPDELLDFVENFATWEYTEYEYFYDPDDFNDLVWRKSRLVSTVIEVSSKLYNRSVEAEEFYSLDREPGRLAMRIIQDFAKDVEARGADFYVVHLPKRDALESHSNGDQLIYSELMDAIREDHVVIDPLDQLLEESKKSSVDALYMPRGHLSVSGNEVVGAEIAKFLLGR